MGKLIPFPGRPAEGGDVPESGSPELFVGSSGEDGGFLPIALVLLAFGMARVWHALLRHEPFGTEATLALFSVVVLPFVIARRCWKYR